MEYGDTTRVYAVLDGRRTGNIFSSDRTGHMPGNTHVSLYFVNWVHTGPKFRRKGLARRTLERSLADPRARRCSCKALFTGTDNVAHALYRSLGFVDVNVHEELNTKLERKAPVLRAKGVTFRPYQPGDEIAMAEVHNKCWSDYFACKPQRPYRRSEEAIALLAHRRGRLMGYVVAGRSEKSARIEDIAALPDKKREDIVKALISHFHKVLLRRGLETVSWWRWSQEFGGYLQSLGYRSRKTGGVSMFGIINLPRFFEEICPLLEKRLEGQDWSGTIALEGEKHRAMLDIEKGRVRVAAGKPSRADIVIKGSDAAITRLVIGVQTAFEQLLQLDLKITPILNGQTKELLTKLFPKLESADDYW
jgi:predicted acetyltransferase